ncbi:MAG: hypothetical protein WKF86_08620, partial [Acidimicrobiales bacterium]
RCCRRYRWVTVSLARPGRPPIRTLASAPLPWVTDDGGRAAEGRAADAGDCVARSITIAPGFPYTTVYAELAGL